MTIFTPYTEFDPALESVIVIDDVVQAAPIVRAQPAWHVWAGRNIGPLVVGTAIISCALTVTALLSVSVHSAIFTSPD